MRKFLHRGKTKLKNNVFGKLLNYPKAKRRSSIDNQTEQDAQERSSGLASQSGSHNPDEFQEESNVEVSQLPATQGDRPVTPPNKTTSSNQVTLVVSGNTFTSGQQNNVYAVGGNLTVNQDTGLFIQLKAELKPVETAAYDAYISSTSRRSHCFEGTREKVLLEIQDWINGHGSQAPVYILDGIAGIGKTTVAQTVAERAAKSGALGASFFFSRDEEQRKIAKYFFPTLAFQLSCFSAEFARAIAEALKQHPDATQKRLPPQFTALILDPLRKLLGPGGPAVLIVVDALDECNEEDAMSVLAILAQYLHELPRLKVFITARPEWHIRDVLDRFKNHEQFHLHDIEDSIVKSDIRLYIDFCFSVEQVQTVFPSRDPPWQLNAMETSMLCGLCGTLFIIAATAVKFVLDTKRANPERQLSRLLEGVSTTDFSGSKHTDVMDKFYIQILRSACPDDVEDDDDWFERYQMVVGTIIVLQNPLPCEALAALLDIKTSYIEDALLHLHSLVAPSGQDRTFRVYHKSFPDFITSKDRLQRAARSLVQTFDIVPKLLIDATGHHLRLTKICLRIMNRDLKSNLTSLPNTEWFFEKSELAPSSISGELAYAGVHWTSHLRASQDLDDEIQKYLDEWASNHILAWLELMCLLTRIYDSYSYLDNARSSIESFAEGWSDKAKVLELIDDTCRLVQQSAQTLFLSPMQLYTSILPFLPASSTLFQCYKEKNLVTVLPEADKAWSPALAVLSGHSMIKSFMFVDFANNGTQLVTASTGLSYASSIRLWDGRTGAYTHSLDGHKKTINSVALSADGLRLVSSSEDQTIRLWDIKTGFHIATLQQHTASVLTARFLGNAARIISTSADQTIRLWNAETGAHIDTLTGDLNTRAPLSVSANALRIAYAFGEDDGPMTMVRLWDGTTGSLVSTLHTQHSEQINLAELSTDGSMLVIASKFNNTMQVWDGNEGVALADLDVHSDMIDFVRFSNDGLRIASASRNGKVRLWETKTYSQIPILKDHTDLVNAVSFSDKGVYLASASDDETVLLRDGHDGTYIATLHGHDGGAKSIQFMTDGSKLASLADDEIIRLWDSRTGERIMNFVGHTRPVCIVKISSDSTRLATGSGDGTVRLWDIGPGVQQSSIQRGLEGHSNSVRKIIFSSDGSRFVSTAWSDHNLQLWDGKTGDPISSLVGHSADIWAIAFTRDGERLATGSEDKTIRLWNGNTGTLITVISGDVGDVRSVSFSSDGSRLVSGGADRALRVWDGKTGVAITSRYAHESLIRFVAFSNDGTRVASAAADGTVRLWDGQTGGHIATVENSASPILFSADSSKMALIIGKSSVRTEVSTGKVWLRDGKTGASIGGLEIPSSVAGLTKPIAFSPDGTVLLTLSDKSTLRLWDVATCKQIGTPFEYGGWEQSTVFFAAFFDGLPRGNDARARPDGPSGWQANGTSSSRTIMVAAYRRDLALHGLLVAAQAGEDWNVFPFLWFPPHLMVESFAINDQGTFVAVACKYGRVFLLDISQLCT